MKRYVIVALFWSAFLSCANAQTIDLEAFLKESTK